MLNIRIQDCENCSEISSYISKLDQKIGTLSRHEYNSIVFLAPKSCASCLKKLIYYRKILSNLYWNANYYCLPYKDIISRVKTLLSNV